MKIKSITKVFPRKVYAIQTSTGTFIADGIAHHNCYHCNINLSGNWLEYERAIIEKYGQKTCDALKNLKWTGDVKYSKSDYVDKIKQYLEKIETLV